MTTGTLGMFWVGLRGSNQTHAQTLAFTTFVLFQFFNIFNARAEHKSILSSKPLTNHFLLLSLGCVLLLQALAVHSPPAQAIFDTTNISIKEWIMIIATASSVIIVEEIRKLATSTVWRQKNE